VGVVARAYIMALNYPAQFKIPQFTGDKEGEDSLRLIQAFKFHIVPLMAQH
jgi:hypothetical protein